MGWIVVKSIVGEEPGKRPRVEAGRPVSFWIGGPEGSAAPFGMAAVGSSSSSFAGPVNGDGPSVVPGHALCTLSTKVRTAEMNEDASHVQNGSLEFTTGLALKQFGSTVTQKKKKNKKKKQALHFNDVHAVPVVTSFRFFMLGVPCRVDH